MSKEEIIKYETYLKDLSRKLRNNSTLSEVILWKYLRAKKLKGLSFLRQKPINNFIVDFYCKEIKLAIEIDGESHIGKETYDDERQKIIESFGITFLRFSDNEIKTNIAGVINSIGKWVEEHPP